MAIGTADPDGKENSKGFIANSLVKVVQIPCSSKSRKYRYSISKDVALGISVMDILLTEAY